MWEFFLGVICALGIVYLRAVEKYKKNLNRQARESLLGNIVNEGWSTGEIAIIDLRDILENEMAQAYLGKEWDAPCRGRNIQTIRFH